MKYFKSQQFVAIYSYIFLDTGKSAETPRKTSSKQKRSKVDKPSKSLLRKIVKSTLAKVDDNLPKRIDRKDKKSHIDMNKDVSDRSASDTSFFMPSDEDIEEKNERRSKTSSAPDVHYVSEEDDSQEDNIVEDGESLTGKPLNQEKETNQGSVTNKREYITDDGDDEEDSGDSADGNVDDNADDNANDNADNDTNGNEDGNKNGNEGGNKDGSEDGNDDGVKDVDEDDDDNKENRQNDGIQEEVQADDNGGDNGNDADSSSEEESSDDEEDESDDSRETNADENDTPSKKGEIQKKNGKKGTILTHSVNKISQTPNAPMIQHAKSNTKSTSNLKSTQAITRTRRNLVRDLALSELDPVTEIGPGVAEHVYMEGPGEEYIIL